MRGEALRSSTSFPNWLMWFDSTTPLKKGAFMNEAEREILLDIFGNTEMPEKITIKLDAVTRNVTITYEDMDEEWFKELQMQWGVVP